MKRQQVDRVIVEEALRLVASAWNMTIEELRIKQKKKFHVPRIAFGYLVCEVFKQPSEALQVINVIKRPSSFRYQARKKMKAWPKVMEKVLSIKWQIENNVIRHVSYGYPLVPHNVILIQAVTDAIFVSFDSSKGELKITGKKLCYIVPRRVFCHLICEVFGQPSNVLHHIGLFKTYAWREFRIQNRKWWRKADRKLRSKVNTIRKKIEESGIPLDSKALVDDRLVQISGEEIASAWDLSLDKLKAKYTKKRALRWPRLAFCYLVCDLLLQPRNALSYLGVKSRRQRDVCYDAKSFAESDWRKREFLFLIRDRVKARLNGEKLPPAPKWREVKGPSVADYANS